MKLFCFPYSGASAMAVYSRWRRKLPAWIDVRPVELPGRGERLSEPLQTRFAALIEQLARELKLELSAPFAFFGHSLGALLAFELAHRMREQAFASPVVLFLSGTRAPAERNDARYAQAFSDQALIEELRSLNGTAQVVFDSPELLELTLPVLRADFQLCGSYRSNTQRSRLNTPIHVFAGAEDNNSNAPEGWRAETHGPFSCDVLPGDHFFIHSRETLLLERLAERATTLMHRVNDGDPRAWSTENPRRASGYER